MKKDTIMVELTQRDLLMIVFALSITHDRLQVDQRYKAYAISAERYRKLAVKLDALVADEED